MKITHPLSERGHDLYETPAEATHALLRAERLPQNLWEPACGPGAIVRVLRGAGHKVVGTDLVDYGSPDQDHGGWDFLLERKLPKLAKGDNVEAIVTNPPFKLAGEFVEHALKLSAFGWFVWHRDHSGPSTWDRISWTPTPDARPARATAQFEASLELPRQEMRTEVKRLLRGAR